MKSRKIPKQAAIALIIGGDLLLLALGWFLLISPQRATANSIAHATEAAQAQIQQAKLKPIVPPKPAAVQQPDIKTANLYALAKAMPSTLDAPNLLLELSQIARASGVKLSAIAPGQSATPPGGGVTTVPITLNVSGNFYTLTDLVYRLRSLVSVRNGELATAGRLYSVSSLSLNPAGSGGSSALTGSLTLDAYVYGSTPAAPAAPVPGATETGSTSTTTTTTTTPAADVAAGP